MTVAELKVALDEHCQDMKRDMPGFLYYGILSCNDGEIIASAQSPDPLAKEIESGAAFHLVIINQVKQILNSSTSLKLELDTTLIETDKVVYLLTISALGKFFSITALDRSKANIGISRSLLAKCKASFGTILDDTF